MQLQCFLGPGALHVNIVLLFVFFVLLTNYVRCYKRYSSPHIFSPIYRILFAPVFLDFRSKVKTNSNGALSISLPTINLFIESPQKVKNLQKKKDGRLVLGRQRV